MKDNISELQKHLTEVEVTLSGIKDLRKAMHNCTTQECRSGVMHKIHDYQATLRKLYLSLSDDEKAISDAIYNAKRKIEHEIDRLILDDIGSDPNL